MALINTSDLSGTYLDWVVAKCEGVTVNHRTDDGQSYMQQHKFSTDWSVAGPIIDRAGITIVKCNDLYFPNGNENGDHYEPYIKATIENVKEYGPTALIAAMRCYVSSKLGSTVKVPYFL